jgi:hypothetical protein
VVREEVKKQLVLWQKETHLNKGNLKEKAKQYRTRLSDQWMEDCKTSNSIRIG